MAQHTSKFQTASTSDRALVEKLIALGGRELAQGWTAEASVTAMGVTVGLLPNAGPDLESLLDIDSSVIAQGSLVRRHPNGQVVSISWLRGQKCFCSVTASHPQIAMHALSSLSEARETFGALDTAEIVDQFMTPEVAAAVARQGQVLAELEAVNLKATNTIFESQRLARDQLKQHREELESEYRARSQELDARHQAKLEEVEEQKAELEKAKAEFDTSESRYARRSLREALLEQITDASKSFSLTADTNRKRAAVRWASVVGLLAFATVFAVAVLHPKIAESTMVATPIRIFGGLGFAGILVFYLRWESTWAQRHADEEFYRRRLALDVNRANWVVEAAAEWATERGSEMPEMLLAPIAYGMFQEGRHEDVKHPSEQLAEMLRQAARVNMKFGDAEIEMKGRDIRKLDKKS